MIHKTYTNESPYMLSKYYNTLILKIDNTCSWIIDNANFKLPYMMIHLIAIQTNNDHNLLTDITFYLVFIQV